MKYSVTHTTLYDYPHDVVIGYNLIHLQPRGIEGPTIRSSAMITLRSPSAVITATSVLSKA